MSSADLETIERVQDRLTRSEKLELIDRVARDLGRRDVAASLGRSERLRVLREEVLAMPVRNPADGFSNVDHDRVLYGETR